MAKEWHSWVKTEVRTFQMRVKNLLQIISVSLNALVECRAKLWLPDLWCGAVIGTSGWWNSISVPFGSLNLTVCKLFKVVPSHPFLSFLLSYHTILLLYHFKLQGITSCSQKNSPRKSSQQRKYMKRWSWVDERGWFKSINFLHTQPFDVQSLCTLVPTGPGTWLSLTWFLVLVSQPVAPISSVWAVGLEDAVVTQPPPGACRITEETMKDSVSLIVIRIKPHYGWLLLLHY